MEKKKSKRKTLGVITARGGSKGVPRKNIALAGGNPLIFWTIDAALRSESVTRLIVSTDDPEIGKVAVRCGAEMPFVRPAELAGDGSPHTPVLTHAVEWMESHEDYHPDLVLLLQPTLPLREPQDIDRAVELLVEKKVDSVVSVCEALSHPYLCKKINGEGFLEDFVTPPEGYLRRQSFPEVYTLNGAIYLIRREILLEQKTLFPELTLGYVMPVERSLDIDTPWDLHVADLILKDRATHERD